MTEGERIKAGILAEDARERSLITRASDVREPEASLADIVSTSYETGRETGRREGGQETWSKMSSLYNTGRVQIAADAILDLTRQRMQLGFSDLRESYDALIADGLPEHARRLWLENKRDPAFAEILQERAAELQAQIDLQEFNEAQQRQQEIANAALDRELAAVDKFSDWGVSHEQLEDEMNRTGDEPEQAALISAATNRRLAITEMKQRWIDDEHERRVKNVHTPPPPRLDPAHGLQREMERLDAVAEDGSPMVIPNDGESIRASILLQANRPSIHPGRSPLATAEKKPAPNSVSYSL